MSNPLVNLLKKAVGLPTGKGGSCCTPVQIEVTPDKATEAKAKATTPSCCSAPTPADK